MRCAAPGCRSRGRYRADYEDVRCDLHAEIWSFADEPPPRSLPGLLHDAAVILLGVPALVVAIVREGPEPRRPGGPKR